jgi:hypothetical protein
MALASTADLLDTLRQARLLAPAQLEELGRLHSQFAEARSLARDLVRRGWLTPYQVNQVFAGRASNLALGQYILLERIGEGGMVKSTRLAICAWSAPSRSRSFTPRA